VLLLFRWKGNIHGHNVNNILDVAIQSARSILDVRLSTWRFKYSALSSYTCNSADFIIFCNDGTYFWKRGCEKKRVCTNTVFQSIFMVDKPSAFTELKESRAYLNGSNAGILYDTHSCLFMSHRNPKRGECLEEEMRVSCRIFFLLPREAQRTVTNVKWRQRSGGYSRGSSLCSYCFYNSSLLILWEGTCQLPQFQNYGLRNVWHNKNKLKDCDALSNLPTFKSKLYYFNTLNAELNPICNSLTLLGAHHILRFSRVRVNFIFMSQ
jgi:hypothetical protein